MAPVGLDGQVLFSTDRDSEPQVGKRRRPAWDATLFRPAFAALDGKPVKVTDPRWWATETRERLAAGAALLGVAKDLPASEADAIAFRLEVPRLMHRQAMRAYASARGRTARGAVLVGLLDALGSDACLLDRILAAGARGGSWGTVTRWDAASGGLRGRVFPGRGAPSG